MTGQTQISLVRNDSWVVTFLRYEIRGEADIFDNILFK